MTTTQRAILFTLIASLLVATRLNLPASLTHLGPIPDASWAAFFLGGFYLRSWTRWAFPVFMALAVLADYVVISGQGMDFFAHYCMSAAYWFLIPAYFALWFGGMLVRRFYIGANGNGANGTRANGTGANGAEANRKVLAVLAASLFGSVVLCHLLSQGSFYWIGDSVADPTVAGWWKNYSDWFIPYLRTAVIYVGLAVIAHVGVTQAARVRARAKSPR